MQPAGTNSQQEKPKKLYLDQNFLVICAVSLIAVLGVSSVTPAFPKLAQALNVNPKNIGLLVTAFTLPTLF
jgi:Ca2+/Na+ antiporter